MTPRDRSRDAVRWFRHRLARKTRTRNASLEARFVPQEAPAQERAGPYAGVDIRREPGRRRLFRPKSRLLRFGRL